MTVKILHVGDIVGSPGRRAFSEAIPLLRKQHGLDLVVANGENSAGGRGISPKLAEELRDAGADLITLGDHTWDQRELAPWLAGARRIIRPANFAQGCPGRGWEILQIQGVSVAVISLIGRVFMPPLFECPFRKADEILRELAGQASIILVEIHAEATSEKIALGRYLEGRVSSVVGTHTHVQTADERILPKGTAYLTDLGMTGPRESVLGRDLQPVIDKFLNGMPTRFSVAGDEHPRLEGALLEVDASTGKALSIERVRFEI